MIGTRFLVYFRQNALPAARGFSLLSARSYSFPGIVPCRVSCDPDKVENINREICEQPLAVQELNLE